MAGKRITKSLIDWAAFAERVAPEEITNFQVFKSMSNGYLRKMMRYPDNPPALNFAAYKSKVADPNLVDEMEKAYKSIKVPYPADTLTVQIDAQEKEAQVKLEMDIQDSNTRIISYQKWLDWYNELMPFQNMTMEDFLEAFPENRIDPVNRPTYWPHDGRVITEEWYDGEPGYKDPDEH